MTLTRHNKLSTVIIVHHNNKFTVQKYNQSCPTVWPVTFLNECIMCDRSHLAL